MLNSINYIRDVNSILSLMWYYFFPVIVVASLTILVLKLSGKLHGKIIWLKYFSSSFISLTLAYFIYYLIWNFTENSTSLYSMLSRFLGSAYYVSFYSAVLSIVFASFMYLNKKRKN